MPSVWRERLPEGEGSSAFEGHYHGWLDNVLIGYRPSVAADKSKAWPTQGMNRSAVDETIVLQWNDLQAVEEALESHGDEIAAIITEPILCNCHCLLPLPGYLEGLRTLATRYGVVLIFDEVITGFRVAPGGAQSLLGVRPDLATFGKAIAGGFPLSVVAGSREIMELIGQQKVMHAGTFNGNPVSLAAAQATLDTLAAVQGAVVEQICKTGELLIQGIQKAAEKLDIPVLINGVGSCFNLAFTTRREMRNYRDTLDLSTLARDIFLEGMLERGIYLMPDGRWYVSAAHSELDVERTLDAVGEVFSVHQRQLRQQP